MQALGKVDGVEHLDFVALFLLQKPAHLGQDTALAVYHHIGRMGLEQLGREPKPGLAGAGRADDTTVEIAGIPWYFGPGVHGEKLCPGQNHIVFKLGIGKRRYVFGAAPTGGAVFSIGPILFRLFCLAVN